MEISVALGSAVDVLFELREEDDRLPGADAVDCEVVWADDADVDIEMLSADGADSVD